MSNNAFKITPGGTVTEIIDATGDGLGSPLAMTQRYAHLSPGRQRRTAELTVAEAPKFVTRLSPGRKGRPARSARLRENIGTRP